jgi:conjugative relaxase-like TrwC/TraI family protein
MLGIGKLGAGAEDYYLSAVAAGREDYYLREGEAPGRWVGQGARSLGLAGEVEAPELSAVLAGRDVQTDERLVRGPGGGRSRTPGFDLTFRAPKSVSLLFALGDPASSAEALASHERAVEAALSHLEDHATHLRRGAGGAERVPALGLVGAAFVHRTSRAGDPALHTHVLVANVAEDHEGRVGALDSRAIYRHAKTAGYLYQAELRYQLGERLGVEWGPVEHGVADIEGVPRRVIEAFSRRRQEIEQRMAERGETSARAAQAAALDTRAAKDYGVSVERLEAQWRARAQELGFGQREIEACLYRAWEREPEVVDVERVFDELSGPQGLTQNESTFTRREAIRTLAERFGSEGASAVGELADRFLSSERVVLLVPDRALPEARYSTPELLATERELLEGAIARRGEGAGQVDERTVDAALAGRPELSHEQAAMVRSLTESGDGLQVVLGRAGSGKTYALQAAREAWEAAGYEVLGAALAARAASELEAGSGIRSRTLARLLLAARDLQRSPLAAMSVVVLDEAGMVGTRDLAELASHTEEAGAKLVLVGDDAQLPEIAAGGGFRALAQTSGPIELSENRRQEQAWERDALLAIREGRAQEAVEAYLVHGRIHVGEDADAAKGALVTDWWRASRAGEDTVMICATRADAEDLSRLARALRQAAGEIRGPALSLPCGEVALGDRVMALRNDHLLSVDNGMRGTVVAADRGRGVEIETAAGRRVLLPGWYLADGELTYADAITAHKAQGLTVDRAFVLATRGVSRGWGYAALSRARARADLYVGLDAGDPGCFADELGVLRAGREEAGLSRLVHDLKREAAQEPALRCELELEPEGRLERGLGRDL